VVLDLRLNLLGNGREAVLQLTNGGVGVDAGGLELLELGLLVLEISLGSING
jgi:hypothetical protein